MENETIFVTVIVPIITVIVPMICTFLITRFGYQKKYKNEIKQLETGISKNKLDIDKSVYETYGMTINAFRSQIEELTASKETLIEQIKRLSLIVNEYKKRAEECKC